MIKNVRVMKSLQRDWSVGKGIDHLAIGHSLLYDHRFFARVSDILWIIGHIKKEEQKKYVPLSVYLLLKLFFKEIA